MPTTASRFPARAAGLAALAALTLTSCGGGGGGGGSGDRTAPQISAAFFLSSGAAPSAGDTLRLFFDETVAVAAGTLLTDADFVLPSGTTLGAVTAAPTVVDSRTLAITLGAGVAITANTSTITLGTGNDAVLDAAGNLGRDGTPVVITRGDADAPVISRLTLNGIDSQLNGTGAAGGLLQVPQTGFSIDLAYSDTTSAVDPAQTQVTASVTVTANGQALTAGTNLLPSLTTGSATGTAASYSVPNSVSFPTGDITLTAFVRDTSGRLSAASTFALRVVAISDDLRPFETGANPNQTWFLDTNRDLESYSLTPTGASTFSVAVTNGANGTADLVDILRLLGLQGNDTSVNTSVVTLWRARLLIELAVFFAGANISFTFTAPGTFPSGQVSVPYASATFSQICIAGKSTDTGVLGLALFDPSNATQNDNCQTSFQGVRLGVFLHTILDNSNGFGGPSTTLFRQTYDPLRSELLGTPVGNDAQDAQRLSGGLNDSRTTVINNAIGRLARFTAVVTAHEAGHSMGLVKNGAMPTGLYGGDPTNFPGSNDQHIRMPTSVFPNGSINIMSPSLNFELAQSSSTAFNTLNLAYLRERVLHNR